MYRAYQKNTHTHTHTETSAD